MDQPEEEAARRYNRRHQQAQPSSSSSRRWRRHPDRRRPETHTHRLQACFRYVMMMRGEGRTECPCTTAPVVVSVCVHSLRSTLSQTPLSLSLTPRRCFVLLPLSLFAAACCRVLMALCSLYPPGVGHDGPSMPPTSQFGGPGVPQGMGPGGGGGGGGMMGPGGPMGPGPMMGGGGGGPMGGGPPGMHSRGAHTRTQNAHHRPVVCVCTLSALSAMPHSLTPLLCHCCLCVRVLLLQAWEWRRQV